jgi:hypothetical protein
LLAKIGDTEAISRKQSFIAPADSADLCPKAEPRE